MECSARESQDSVKVTVLHQGLEDVTRLVSEEHIVRHDHSGATAWFERRHDVLDEIELLVARLDHKVVAIRRLIRASGSEGRVRKDHVEALGARCLIDRVSKGDVWLNLMKVEIHQREAT